MINILKAQGDQGFAVLSEELSAISDLKSRVVRLQNENHYLRRSNRVQPHLRLVLRAEAAANLIAMWHLAGYRTGRKACRGHGMTEPTWFAGRALLMAGRLWQNNHFTTNDPDTIQARIAVTVERAKRDPSVIGYRIPLSKRPKSFVG